MLDIDPGAPLTLNALLLVMFSWTALGQDPGGEPASGVEQASSARPESVWEVIEQNGGAALTQEDIEAAKELADQRFAEQAVVERVPLFHEPDTDFYLDPKSVLEFDPLHLDKIAPAEFDIPVVVNPMVEKWMRYFLGSGRKWYVRWLGRSTRYKDLIDRQMKAKGLPRDLLYVSMVESGFSPYARSFAEAVGLWQFISSTGRSYGLQIDYWVDERRDPERATEAAANFFKDLHNDLGDWYLAWAAYNGGPGRVNRAIRDRGTRNFWVLAESGALPSETANYVPKILAAAIIGKHPERYGFGKDVVVYEAPLLYETVEVEGAVSIDVLAKCAETKEEDFAALNPAILRGATPPTGKAKVRLPVGKSEVFNTNFAKVPPEERLSFRKHTVAKGESLGSIAKHYGVSVNEIVVMNRISNPNRIYPGMELVIPLHGATLPPPEPVKSSGGGSTTSTTKTSPASTTTVVHTVKKGENLAQIASHYGVSTAQLVEWNNLKDADHIEPGQKLNVKGQKSSTSTKSTTATKLTYTVEKGDTASVIASRFGVSVEQLAAWNGLKDASEIRVGQVLKLYGSAESWKTYTVKKGDSLGKIADANGCTIDELKSWNNLKGSTIYAGQKLRIKVD